MKLQVSRIAHPVTVLGPGRRLGVWVQGCHIHCSGCASTDTWSPLAGTSVEVNRLADNLAEVFVTERLTGLTLTGGEPTEQADALAELVCGLRDRLAPPSEDATRDVDVLVFTGLAARTAARRAASLWSVADAAVCGPYRPDRPSAKSLIASANQQLIVRTALGRARYAKLDNSRRVLQRQVADRDITFIGLPEPGELPRLEAALLARGVSLEGRSWEAR